MPNLPRYTLSFDRAKKDWALTKDGAPRARKRFSTKDEATRGGILEGAVGNAGGSVKIKKKDGTYQEERTYPRSADPRRSKG